MPTTRSDQVPVDPDATGVDGLTTEDGASNPLGFDDAMAFLEGDAPPATQQGASESADAPAEAEPGPETEDGDEEGILTAHDMGLHDPEDAQEPEGAAADAVADADADTEDPDASEEAEPAQTGDLDAFVAQVNEKFEDIGAQSPDDVLTELERERASNDIIVDVLDTHPEVMGFFEDVVRANQRGEGVDVSRLAQDHFDTALPDPAEDPEGYRKAVQQRERRNAQRETQAAQRERQLEQVEQQMQQMQQTAQKSIEKVADEYGLEGQRLKRFRQNVANFVNNPDADFAKVLYQGMHFDDLVERAYEKGMQKGRTESVNARKERKSKGNAIPKLSSSRTGSDTPSNASSGEEDLADFAKSLQRNKSTLADLAGLT